MEGTVSTERRARPKGFAASENWADISVTMQICENTYSSGTCETNHRSRRSIIRTSRGKYYESIKKNSNFA